jgi:hypothetical protein
MPKRVRHKKIQGEARRSPRRNARGRTTVIYARGAFKPLTSSILDSSDHGLRIAVPPRTVLPERIWLLDHRNTLVNGGSSALAARRCRRVGTAGSLRTGSGDQPAPGPVDERLVQTMAAMQFNQNLGHSLRGTFAVLREICDNTVEFAGILSCS